MTTKLIYVRHGETEWNSKGLLQGTIDIPLSKKGLEQAKRLAQRLKDEKIDVIYSSPLSRALQTANEIAKVKNLKVHKIKDLEERRFGDWEGKKLDEIFEKYIDQKDFNTVRPKGGENFHDVEKRIIPVFDKLLSKHKKKTILISSHGGIANAILGYYLHIPIEHRFILKISNCSISILKFSDEGHRIESVNDNLHLKDLK